MLTILMTTYNGENFLDEQLYSILEEQNFKNFKIIISDDASTDRTWDILKEWEEKYPNKIKVEPKKNSSLGAAQNFLSLMTKIEDEYIMLSDQDDVWLQDKISNALKSMKLMEDKYGKDKPCLYHTDLKVVDQELNEINSSFANQVGLAPVTTLRQALTQNDVTGCTVIYNRALFLKIKGKTPSYCVMHDWWLALVAHAFGKKEYSTASLILYRQHGYNVYGAKKNGFFHKIYFWKKIKTDLFNMYEQAAIFLKIYGSALSVEQKKMLEDFCSIKSQSKFRRISSLRKGHFFRSGYKRKLSQIFFG